MDSLPSRTRSIRNPRPDHNQPNTAAFKRKPAGLAVKLLRGGGRMEQDYQAQIMQRPERFGQSQRRTFISDHSRDRHRFRRIQRDMLRPGNAQKALRPGHIIKDVLQAPIADISNSKARISGRLRGGLPDGIDRFQCLL